MAGPLNDDATNPVVWQPEELNHLLRKALSYLYSKATQPLALHLAQSIHSYLEVVEPNRSPLKEPGLSIQATIRMAAEAGPGAAAGKALPPHFTTSPRPGLPAADLKRVNGPNGEQRITKLGCDFLEAIAYARIDAERRGKKTIKIARHDNTDIIELDATQRLSVLRGDRRLIWVPTLEEVGSNDWEIVL